MRAVMSCQQPWTSRAKNRKANHMKNRITNKTLLAGAAIAGILTNGVISTASAASVSQSSKVSFSAGTMVEKKGETHECKGHNSCKGKGGCKSGDNGCAGKNSCKGKGGCGMKNGKPNPPKS
jgi:hypothetical protein